MTSSRPRFPTCFIGDDLGGDPVLICMSCGGPPSHSAEDVANRFCGYCKLFHEPAFTSSLVVADYAELDGLITKLTWLMRKLRARPPLEDV